MARKLNNLKPTVATLSPRIGFSRDPTQGTIAPPTWKRWYHTKRWVRLRWSVLVRDRFTCRMCKRMWRAPELVADHIKPHRGNAVLFWDTDNLQTLCSAHHNSAKQKAEAATPPGMWD